MYRVSRAFPFTEFRGLGMESLMEQHQEGGGCVVRWGFAELERIIFF